MPNMGGVAGIPAERLREICPVSKEYEWQSRNLAEIARIKNYLVVVEVVVLHLPLEMAIQSGLFGGLGEEAIKLVDVADTETIQKYQELWASSGSRRDSEPEQFSNNLESLQIRVRQWAGEVEGLWLRYRWNEARKAGWHGVEHPQDIWLGFPTKDDVRLLRRLTLGRFVLPVENDHFRVDTDRLLPNRAHPFVQRVLDEMPRFQPRVMFRHCHRNCHIPELRWRRPSPRRGGTSLRGR